MKEVEYAKQVMNSAIAHHSVTNAQHGRRHGMETEKSGKKVVFI